MRRGDLERLRHKIADMLTKTAAGATAERLEVRLMDGTHHEVIDITYPDDRAVMVFITQPLGYEEYLLGESRKIHEARTTRNDEHGDNKQ